MAICRLKAGATFGAKTISRIRRAFFQSAKSASHLFAGMIQALVGDHDVNGPVHAFQRPTIGGRQERQIFLLSYRAWPERGRAGYGCGGAGSPPEHPPSSRFPIIAGRRIAPWGLICAYPKLGPGRCHDRMDNGFQGGQFFRRLCQLRRKCGAIDTTGRHRASKQFFDLFASAPGAA